MEIRELRTFVAVVEAGAVVSGVPDAVAALAALPAYEEAADEFARRFGRRHPRAGGSRGTQCLPATHRSNASLVGIDRYDR